MQTKQTSIACRAGRLRSFVAFLGLCIAAMPSLAEANPKIVVDVNTGRVIEHEDAFRKWYPASLTKLMTAYTTFSAIRSGQLALTSIVTMSKNAVDQPASKMYFNPGAKLTLDSALKILLVKSANDVAVAVAETVSGSVDQFVARMNADAARLGMSSSHFVNPNGLPGLGQYTTARDLAVLAVAIRREFPEYANFFALEGITTGTRVYPNYNLLIGRFDGADGMKTGYICASGFNQVSSATRNGRTVVSVVLGAESLGARADISAELLQKALTTRANTGVKLEALAPYGQGLDTVTDISGEICTPEARKVRSEARDEDGKMKIYSPYIREMDRPPHAVFAGLLPGSDAPSKPGSAGGKIANVPIPIPRPTF